MQVASIARYPVKSLRGEALEAADLVPGRCIESDRRFAIAHENCELDARSPAWLPRRHFSHLAKDSGLALLGARFDACTNRLVLLEREMVAVSAEISTADGCRAIDDFLRARAASFGYASMRLVELPGIAFTDTEDSFISLINLASVRDLGRRMGVALDPRRFRSNLVVEHATPWAELEWLGRELHLGTARLAITAKIDRCAATNVNPDTAERDLNIPTALRRLFGHIFFGVALNVVSAGTVSRGDNVSVLPR